MQSPLPLSIGAVDESCDVPNLNYRVTFPIAGGTPPYFVNGLPSGSVFVSSLIPSGEPYNFLVTDSGVCGGSSATVAGAFTCPSFTQAGTMELMALHFCEAQMAAATWHNDAVLDGNDALVFVLHTSGGATLGNVLGVNSTGVFGFLPGQMSFGQSYFISAVAGNELNGSVDFGDPNLSVAPGQPVTFFSNPTLDLLPPEPLTCAIPLGMLTALPGGGSGDFSMNWTGANSFVSSLQNPLVNAGGSYDCIATDNLTGCTASASVQVEEDKTPPDLAAAGCELNCNLPACELLASSTMPGAVFTWTFPTGEQMSGAGISTNIPGQYLVSAAAPNGCVSQENVQVTDASVPPDIYVSSGDIVCGKPATLTATSNTPGVVFTWILPDGTTAAGSSLSATEPGIYFATATDPVGCTNEAEAQVGQTEPVIQPFFEVKSPTCFGWEDGYIRLDSVVGGTPPYLFSLVILPPDFPFENIGAGEYPLHITDANGCIFDTIMILSQPPLVTVELGEDKTILPGETVELKFEANIVPVEIQWVGSDGQTFENELNWLVQPSASGIFSVKIADANACEAADSLQIFVEETPTVFVPNAFSPNGDGKNDRLTIFTGKDVAQVHSFRIFDRWGDLVFVAENFQPTDFANGWDGTAKGKALDPAVFVFLAEIEMKNGEVNLISGDVTLIR